MNLLFEFEEKFSVWTYSFHIRKTLVLFGAKSQSPMVGFEFFFFLSSIQMIVVRHFVASARVWSSHKKSMAEWLEISSLSKCQEKTNK